MCFISARTWWGYVNIRFSENRISNSEQRINQMMPLGTCYTSYVSVSVLKCMLDIKLQVCVCVLLDSKVWPWLSFRHVPSMHKLSLKVIRTWVTFVFMEMRRSQAGPVYSFLHTVTLLDGLWMLILSQPWSQSCTVFSPAPINLQISCSQPEQNASDGNLTICMCRGSVWRFMQVAPAMLPTVNVKIRMLLAWGLS